MLKKRIFKWLISFQKMDIFNIFLKNINTLLSTLLSYKRQKIVYIVFLLIICTTYIKAFELENIDPFKLAIIMMLPQTSYYKETRFPVVFTERIERYDEFAKEQRKKNFNPPPAPMNIKSSEDFHKQKCKIKEFYYIREIAYTYNPGTVIKWESCDTLEIEKKKYLLDGKDDLIPIIVKERIDRWKKALFEEIDELLVKPLPKFNPKIIKGSIHKEAEEYYNILINHILDGEFLGTVVGTEDKPHTFSSSSWHNRQIDEFNHFVYDEKISLQEKKFKIHLNSELLKKLGISYLYAMMTSNIIKLFPAETQVQENEMVLSAIHNLTDRLLTRLDRFPNQKKRLTNAISCLENWPKWHKENLRIAYYYGFFIEYGNEVRFSKDLKKNSEYFKMAEAIENKILNSDIFIKRLERIEMDICNVLRKSPKEIEMSF